MKEEQEIIKKCGKGNPFKVPEGYFEDFTRNMMAQLPAKEDAKNDEVQTEPRITPWQRIKPLLYMAAMFIGMIAAFLGFVFCDFSMLWNPTEGVAPTTGLIPVCVMATSAVVMAICGTIATKCKIRWLTDYALPMSLIVGMASAIPFTMLLGG